MSPAELSSVSQESFELFFPSLSLTRRSLSFPCDSTGSVYLDAMSEHARDNYMFARALMGREFGSPTVLAAIRG